VALTALAALTAFGQENIRYERGLWTGTFTGTLSTSPRLRINASGPVIVDRGGGGELSYRYIVSVRAGSEEEARRLLDRYQIKSARIAGWTNLTAPAGAQMSRLELKSPRLVAADISTSDGSVEVNRVDGQLTVNSVGGSLRADRVSGGCRLTTGGGNIIVGEIGEELVGTTGGGNIMVHRVRGTATLRSGGGEIVVADAGGDLDAETGGGTVRVDNADANVTASSGGGPIVVNHARGVVTARSMAGPVQVGAAAGVRIDSGSGAVRMTNVYGPMRVSTAMGSIMAALLAGFSDSFLATGNGDITVWIPSNLGVTIRAENDLADSLRRIVSDFPALAVRMRGTQIVAEGPVNGGGPVLQITGTGGTIFIKRQQ
jgi:DUF4097 and DUF4098 domain-containing protein YvlB